MRSQNLIGVLLDLLTMFVLVTLIVSSHGRFLMAIMSLNGLRLALFHGRAQWIVLPLF